MEPEWYMYSFCMLNYDAGVKFQLAVMDNVAIISNPDLCV